LQWSAFRFYYGSPPSANSSPSFTANPASHLYVSSLQRIHPTSNLVPTGFVLCPPPLVFPPGLKPFSGSVSWHRRPLLLRESSRFRGQSSLPRPASLPRSFGRLFSLTQSSRIYYLLDLPVSEKDFPLSRFRRRISFNLPFSPLLFFRQFPPFLFLLAFLTQAHLFFRSPSLQLTGFQRHRSQRVFYRPQMGFLRTWPHWNPAFRDAPF